MHPRSRLLLPRAVRRGIQLLWRLRLGVELHAIEQLALPVGDAMTHFELGCRALLAVVLAAAATGKLRRRDFEAFTVALRGFGVPARLARAPLAALVVVLEVTAAVLLVAAPSAGYALALGLIAAFTVALRRVVRSGQQVACRCFGASTAPVGVAHLVRNGALLAVIGLGIVAEALADGEPSALAVRLVAIACGALAGAGITRWDDLAYVVRPALAERRR
jgi:uncharacterized membrane protein YphA (DoxX/SURF4 family)